MIVPLPIYVTSEAQARSSMLRLLGDLKLCGRDYPDRFFRIADAAMESTQSMQDVAQVEDLAARLVAAVEGYAELRADHAVAEQHARKSAGEALWLANTLIDLRHRYQQLDTVLEDLDARTSLATPPPPAAPEPGPSAPEPLRVL